MKQNGRNLLTTIKGKILVMGGVSILASVALGYMGVSALNRNSKNNDVLTQMNHINLLQYENQSLDTSYLYFLEDSYLENIVTNLETMQENAQTAKGKTGSKFAGDISSIEEVVTQCRDNYTQIRKLSSQRGFVSETGNYAEFLADDESLGELFQTVADDKSWVDGTWIDIGGGNETVTAGDRNYIKMTYSNEVPEIGKRDSFLVRVGGTGVEYSGDVYVSNIVFHGKNGDLPIDIALLTSEDLSGSYGDALMSMEQADFNGTPGICVEGKFTAANAAWEEITVKIPAGDYNMQEYDSVSYDLYLQAVDLNEMRAACAFADKYDFAGKLKDLNEDFLTYSKHVVEGSDVSEEAQTIQTLFDEIISNISAYVSDEAIRTDAENKMKNKMSLFQTMNEQDNTILSLKKENIELSGNLTSLTSDVRERVEADTDTTKNTLTTMMLVILIISTAVLVLNTLVISHGMNRSIRRFKDTLSAVTDGNLSVRADIKGKDEFSEFGLYLNRFLERLTEVIHSAQFISESLKHSGEELDLMAKDSNSTSSEIGKAVEEISNGAVTQAGEIDIASGSIADMAEVFTEIVGNVEHLGSIAGEMKSVSSESAVFMEELNVANSKTSDAFAQVAQQIHTTNESVNKIREATELITSIAGKTNLLSLNASIEAARAGEAGRGFAVVATEIQQLAEQSGSSAEIIKRIIEELAGESQMTVNIVDEVSEIVKSQQEKLTQTIEHFRELEDGINSSNAQTYEIKERTAVCDASRIKVEEVITSLSAISEGNAASSEETTASMTELNENIGKVVEASRQLKELAGKLEQDLKFFYI